MSREGFLTLRGFLFGVNMAQPPTIWERVALAWKVFSQGMPWSRELKESPFMWPTWAEGRAQWGMVGFDNYVTEGFNMNSLIYSAIMFKARSIMTAPLRAYSGDPENPTPLKPDHQLSQLLHRPNDYQSGPEFWQSAVVHLNIAGNAYVHLDRGPSMIGFPKSMRLMRPDRVFIIPKDGRILGYLYVPEGKSREDGLPIVATDMIHVKFPNPGDRFEGWGYGLSPITSVARSGDVDNRVTEFLGIFFARGTMASFLLSTENDLSDAQAARIRERWTSIYGGSENWAEVAVLDKNTKAQRLNMSFEEMGFGAIDERNESRILGPFGVPPILIGTRVGLNRSTYSNYEQARRAFWEDTFVPELRLFETEVQHFLGSAAAWPAFDFGQVPALQKNIIELIGAAQTLFDMGMPLNQAMSTVGVDSQEVAGGDVGYLPSTLIPATSVGMMMPGQMGRVLDIVDGDRHVSRPVQIKVDNNHHDKEMRKRLWKAVDTTAVKWEAAFHEEAVAQFEKDKRAILAIIRDEASKSREAKASISWQNVLLRATDYLATVSQEAWREAFLPHIMGLVGDQATNLTLATGIAFNVENVAATGWFDTYTLKFAQPINTTTRNTISNTLQLSQRDGTGINKTVERLKDLFDVWQGTPLSPEDFEWIEERMPFHRSEAIARTETMRASNAGSQALFADADVARKEWLATMDDRVRDSHEKADGDVVKLGASFTVGGHDMDYPGDMSNGAPLDEIVNCRCTIAPVVED